MRNSRSLYTVISTVLSLPISVPARSALECNVWNHDTPIRPIAEMFRSDLEEGAGQAPSGSD